MAIHPLTPYNLPGPRKMPFVVINHSITSRDRNMPFSVSNVSNVTQCRRTRLILRYFFRRFRRPAQQLRNHRFDLFDAQRHDPYPWIFKILECSQLSREILGTLKSLLRKASARTIASLWKVIGVSLSEFSSNECGRTSLLPGTVFGGQPYRKMP